MKKTLRITVRGTGAFPLDMLRYDACYPFASDDIEAITNDRCARNVRLIVTHAAPTPDRWASFTWPIIHSERF
jgi:hypothetical protein